MKPRSVGLLIENTSGQGGHVGYRFEHLARILERVGDPERSGVCLDTCHVFAAGYDMRTAETYEKTMGSFDAIVGRRYLRAAHLNDSKVELGSRKDRHDSIGRGQLGLEAFRLLMNDPALRRPAAGAGNDRREPVAVRDRAALFPGRGRGLRKIILLKIIP